MVGTIQRVPKTLGFYLSSPQMLWQLHIVFDPQLETTAVIIKVICTSTYYGITWSFNYLWHFESQLNDTTVLCRICASWNSMTVIEEMYSVF